MKNILRNAAFAALMLLSAFGAAAAQKKTMTAKTDALAHLQPEHRQTVRRWLKANPTFRAATAADCKNKYGLKSMRSDDAKFHPFYAAFNFTGSAVEDFAVGVIDPTAKADSQFTVLIFKSDGGGEFKLLHRIAGADLRQGGIWRNEIETGVNALYVGEFETDNCSYLTWDGKKVVVRDCEGN